MSQQLTDVQEATEKLSEQNHPDSPITHQLQRQVANSLVMFVNYKHYHWQVYGPQFRDFHLMFDEFATAVLETFDEFAERLRMIGQDPIFALDEVRRATSIESSSGKHRSLREMIEEADRNSIRVIQEMRQAAKEADDLDDPGTADLFTRFVQVHEKQEWYFREILKTDTRLEPGVLRS